MKREEKAIALHDKGYNCAQAVACSFADVANMDEAALFAAAEGFGLGMGGMDATCGAVSGAVLLAGLKNSSRDPGAITKGATYRLCRQMVRLFKEETGALVCRELKGVENGRPLVSCETCICTGVKIACRVLELPEEI